MTIWRTTIEVAVRAGSAAEAAALVEGYVEDLASDGAVVEVTVGPGWTEEPDNGADKEGRGE